MAITIDKWTWIGVGSCIIFFLIIALVWLCKSLNCFTKSRKFVSFQLTKRRKRELRRVTLTLKKEERSRIIKEIDLSQSSVTFQNDSLFFNEPEGDEKSTGKIPTINTNYTHRFKYFRNVSTTDRSMISSTNKSRSLCDGFQSRSMARILWQDLTMTTSDNAVIEEEFTERKLHSRERSSVSKKGNVEITRIHKSSRRIFRQAWGKNSVKLFLFAKLVAGYFTVDRSGNLCKVNDWRHVSGQDLRYREKAIFNLVCLNQLHVELLHQID